jgi:hypothetical protein
MCNTRKKNDKKEKKKEKKAKALLKVVLNGKFLNFRKNKNKLYIRT